MQRLRSRSSSGWPHRHHHSVFLDLDLEKGIVGGQSWERTLVSQAAIVPSRDRGLQRRPRALVWRHRLGHHHRREYGTPS
jgi:hypothetical protein